jgi:hypothetical protein
MAQFKFKDIKNGSSFYVTIETGTDSPVFMNDIIKSIEMSINTGSDECFVGEMTFMYGRSCEVTLDKSEWSEFLYHSVYSLERLEQYEKCQMILALIKKIK